MSYIDEMKNIVDKATDNARKVAYTEGYWQGVLDFYNATQKTHATPFEIMEKLNPYPKNKYE